MRLPKLRIKLEAGRGAGVVGPAQRLAAAAVGIGICAIYIVLQPDVGSAQLEQVWSSTFGSTLGVTQLLQLTAPLVLAGCAAAVVQRVRLWNLGIQGQLIMGAWVATLFAYAVPDLPGPILVPGMLVCGCIGGAAWIAVPALARAFLGVNEVITTLMLNFVAGLWLVYWATGPWIDSASAGAGALYSRPISANATFAQFSVGGVDISMALPIALGLTVLLWAAFRYTHFGYSTPLAAGDERTASYAGANGHRIALVLLLGSGAIGGLTGAVIEIDQVHSFSSPLTGGEQGYIAIVVALLAGNSFLGVMPSGLLMAIIVAVGSSLSVVGLSPSVILLMTGILLLVASTSQLLARFRLEVDQRSPESNERSSNPKPATAPKGSP